MEDPINIDDLGVPPFQETSICWLTFPLYRKLAKRSKKDAGLLHCSVAAGILLA